MLSDVGVVTVVSAQVALLREAARGAESRWAPYIAMLPTDIPLSNTFTSSELAALQDDGAVAFAQVPLAPCITVRVDEVRR